MPIRGGVVSCPWCRWKIDFENVPMSEESAQKRLDHHKRYCPNRRSQSHPRTQKDIHGESVFEENANQ